MTSTEFQALKQSILDDVRVMMQTTGQVTQYIGARYVPLIADPIEWSDQKEYEPLTIVTNQGNSYTSRQFVPKGTPITNEQFWAATGNFNAQIEQYRQEVAKFDSRISAAQNAADSKAPINHASDSTEYGIGNSSNYGHVKLDDTMSVSDSNNGVAATPKLVKSYMCYVKPEAYGAIGDGTHDDTNAIKSAIATGNPVYLSMGKIYSVTEPIYIDNSESLLCDGYIKAASTFNGEAVIIIGTKTTTGANVLSLPTGINFVIKVDCNWKDCDGIHVCSSFGNFYNCIIKNFTKNGLKTGVAAAPSYIIQSAENVYNVHCDNGTSDIAKQYHNTVGLYLLGNDDNFNTVTTANIVKGVYLKAYNTFNIIHSWISIPELFDNSIVLESENGKYTANEIYCDGHQTALNLIGASAGCKAHIRINQHPQNNVKPVKVFKHKGGNYASGPYFDGEFYVSDVNNEPIIIHSNDYENGFITAHVNGKNIQWISDDGSIGKLFQTDGVTVGTVKNPSGLTSNYLPSGTNEKTFFLAKCTRRAFAELTAFIILSEQRGNIYMISQISKGDDATSKFTTANWKSIA